MTTRSLIVSPAAGPRSVRTADGKTLDAPEDWDLLPPGDAALTRKVKAAGPSWTIQVKRGRKIFSRGVWAPRVNIETARAQLEAHRSTDAYRKKREGDLQRRARKHEQYVRQFRERVLRFLDFHPRHAELAVALADAVTAHATPVGSGTVARTQRIPVEERAAAAVIAWMRHQTSGYERMVIQRKNGLRRQVRRELAQQARVLLQRYRRGLDPEPGCPLQRALELDAERAERG